MKSISILTKVRITVLGGWEGKKCIYGCGKRASKRTKFSSSTVGSQTASKKIK